MSYQESAEKINTLFKIGFENNNKQQIIDAVLWFGQVAKFRCRNNSAYDNFSRLVFAGITELERRPVLDGSDFEVLRVKV